MASQRVGELDAMRGLAALGVVLFHYTTQYSREIGHLPSLEWGFPAGNYGVNLFFLISGYVIFMTLERTASATDFVVSRFSRLFPAYWAAILMTSAVVYTIGLPQQRLPAGDWWLNFTMLQQVLGGEHLDGSYWTLQVELFFYLAMLVFHLLGWLRHMRLVLAGWLLLSGLHAVSQFEQWHFSYTLRETLILRFVPYFALGILFYFRHVGRARPRTDALLMLACVALAGLHGGPLMLLVAMFCAGVFLLFVSGRLQFLRQPSLLWLGAFSYPLYLVHQAIGIDIIHVLESSSLPSWSAVPAAIVIVLVLAHILHVVVEVPAMRAIRRAWRNCPAVAASFP